MGLPEEKLKIKDGNIYINGEVVVDPQIDRNFYYNGGDYGKDREEIFIPKDAYYVLGDNSISSSDSRFWGFVELNDIKGKVITIYWPPERWGGDVE